MVGICIFMLTIAYFCILPRFVMTEHAKQAIRTITAEVLPTKTGFVRTLIPEIEEALAAGYNLRAIWERIRTQRSDLTYSQFCVYLHRIRKKPVRTAAARGGKGDVDAASKVS